MEYVYKDGDYNCDKCGILGDFTGGGIEDNIFMLTSVD